MKILVLDNYDSFTYNLVKIIRDLGYGEDTIVARNDKISIKEVEKFDKILLSPGPGIPEEAGIMKKLIKKYGPDKNILGICLGHQGIAEVYGSRIFNMKEVLHGIPGRVSIRVSDETLFAGMPVEFQGCHYHSWAVAPDSVNGELEITAVDEKGIVMGIRHKKYKVKGLQFHPESILTEYGELIIKNWLTE